MSHSSTYTFDVSAYACINAEGTLMLYWEKGDGCQELVLSQENWDGTEVSVTFDDEDFCGSTYDPGVDVLVTSVTVKATGDPDSTPEIVTVTWSSTAGNNCVQAYGDTGGSFDVTIDSGAACNVPDC